MILQQALRRELAYTAGAVFLVMLTFMLTSLVIRILGMAANGKASPNDVLMLIGLATIGYLSILLSATLFISTLIVLTRWYKDSEMVVWFSAGISLRDLVKPVLQFAAPFIVLALLLGMFAWPWANQQSALFRDRFEQRGVMSMIAAGRFIEPAKANYVLFIEGIDADMKHARNVFVANAEADKIGVALAHQGQFETMPNGDRLVVMENGRRYSGTPGQIDYRIVEFERYAVKVDNKPPESEAKLPPKSRDTIDLIRNPTRENLGELIWRISLPILAFNFVMIAIPLAYVNPRLGRYTPLVFAVLIYLTYSNLINLTQSWVRNGSMPFWLAWWPIHLAVFLGALLLFRYRQNRSLGGWRAVFGLRRRDAAAATGGRA
ncbi:LPS export ABC transporter permease LptF [Cupriavidus taiwanensis]|uniref:Lipopolysaccharide export system permease protein LptF n=1 Tax=Cupriavidus taiwanensis TaxID=164546 RepID=A0A976A143_9BURK|nr:LPS export ABC transporter permease LptF [Cupriavidus taiwanensis]MDK3021918.1 LPS export ABC transporter permease LptF [Cupriavidus taiwanensis]NSX12485.1 LPS export ABC transporter permease LptF [Cupriavidus taiwanensis]SOY50917.1 putative permease, YjgP/YjgQ family [Cupriavidus taiwanensis]